MGHPPAHLPADEPPEPPRARLQGGGDHDDALRHVVRNDLDRFHLVQDTIDRVAKLGSRYAHVRQAMADKLVEHRRYIVEHGDDMPEVRDWRWRG
ncbi:MAG TPA: hypothetical protein VIY73_07015 [Polyangiaceae bacterium]